MPQGQGCAHDRDRAVQQYSRTAGEAKPAAATSAGTNATTVYAGPQPATAMTTESNVLRDPARSPPPRLPRLLFIPVPLLGCAVNGRDVRPPGPTPGGPSRGVQTNGGTTGCDWVAQWIPPPPEAMLSMLSWTMFRLG